MKRGSEEAGLLPRKRGPMWGAGVALGILGIIVLFGASTAFALLPGAFSTTVYLSVLGTAFMLILVGYLLVR